MSRLLAALKRLDAQPAPNRSAVEPFSAEEQAIAAKSMPAPLTPEPTALQLVQLARPQLERLLPAVDSLASDADLGFDSTSLHEITHAADLAAKQAAEPELEFDALDVIEPVDLLAEEMDADWVSADKIEVVDLAVDHVDALIEELDIAEESGEFTSDPLEEDSPTTVPPAGPANSSRPHIDQLPDVHEAESLEQLTAGLAASAREELDAAFSSASEVEATSQYDVQLTDELMEQTDLIDGGLADEVGADDDDADFLVEQADSQRKLDSVADLVAGWGEAPSTEADEASDTEPAEGEVSSVESLYEDEAVDAGDPAPVEIEHDDSEPADDLAVVAVEVGRAADNAQAPIDRIEPAPTPAQPLKESSIPREFEQFAEAIQSRLGPKPAVIGFLSVDVSRDRSRIAAEVARAFVGKLPGEVLAVDASDARRLSSQVGGQDGAGLTELIQQGISLDSCLQRSFSYGLRLLPRGGASRLDGVAIRESLDGVVKEIRRQFPLAVVDLGRGEGPVDGALAGRCDAVYLVVRIGETPREDAKQAVKWLQDAGVPEVACVVSRSAG